MRLSIAIAATGLLLSSVALRAQDADSTTTTLSVDARLVVVPVTVRDNKDRLVRTLTRDSFKLWVDRELQTIRYFDHEDNLPLTLGLLVDVSGSQRTVLEDELEGSAAFLDNMLQPGRDQAFVIQFDSNADLLCDLTQSLPKLQASLSRLAGGIVPAPQFKPHNFTSSSDFLGQYGGGRRGGGQGGGSRGGGGQGGGFGGGGTVLYDAVYLSSEEIMRNAKNRKALILLTDGDDRGSRESLAGAIESAQRSDVTVYSILYRGESFSGITLSGIVIPGDNGNDGEKVLERMAEQTGGKVYVVSKREPLTEIYKQIAEELRSQYRLGFSPKNRAAGYHKVIVDVPADHKVRLQAREGYYTGDAEKK